MQSIIGEIKLNEKDVILYYTDGVTETSNALGQRFDEERLIKIFQNCVSNLLLKKF